jgi:hypothetical protein
MWSLGAFRVPLVCLLLVLCGSLIACSSDEADEIPPPVALPVTTSPGGTELNLTGRYRGTFASTVQPGTGTIAVEFFQSAGNGTVTGTISFTGSPCFRTGTIVGTLNGTAFEGLVQFGGGVQITLMATVAADGKAASGGYAVNMNSTACSRDQGQFTLVRQ